MISVNRVIASLLNGGAYVYHTTGDGFCWPSSVRTYISVRFIAAGVIQGTTANVRSTARLAMSKAQRFAFFTACVTSCRVIIRRHIWPDARYPIPLYADQHHLHASAEHTRRSPHHSGSHRLPGHARRLGPEKTEEENAGYGGIISPLRGTLIRSPHSATPNWLGFARRYFTLYESGVLSYAFGPGEPVRDQISLAQAAISNEPW